MHVVCSTSAEEDWSFFPDLAGRPGIRSRVHRRPAPASRWRTLLALPVTLVRSFIRSPRATVRYLRRGRRRLGPSVLTRLQRDADLVALEPDAVHFQFGALAVGREWLAELFDCALIVSFQGYDLNFAGLEEEPGYYAEVWRRADAIHFLGHDLRARAERRGWTPQVGGRVILPGVDASRFDPGVGRYEAEAGTDARPLRVLSVGRLHWKKGYDFALGAVRSLIDRGVRCEYRIVGEGEGRDAVVFTIHDLELTDAVTLLGAVPTEEVQEQLSWSDVFLHAATSEGFCYAVTEAQAMCVPVVTSDADGLGENVEDGVTGFVVPRRDTAALTDALMRMARDPGLRERMGTAGRERVLTVFDLKRQLDGFEELYREVFLASPVSRGG